MATYFFHLCNGSDVLIDPDGRQLAPDDIAPMALSEARALISADAGHGHIYLDQNIEVRDSQGSVVHRLAFEDAVFVTHEALRKR